MAMHSSIKILSNVEELRVVVKLVPLLLQHRCIVRLLLKAVLQDDLGSRCAKGAETPVSKTMHPSLQTLRQGLAQACS